MNSLRQIIQEIHRRSLLQVVGIYLGGSWLAYQVVLNLTEGVGLPQWVPAFAIVLLLLGLPIVVATAFVQEAQGREPAHGEQAGGGEGDRSAATTVRAGVNRTPLPQPLAVRLLTWPRALLGGVVAFALLGAGTTGYMTLRVLGIGPAGSLLAAGVIDASDRIIVADFHSTTGDSVLAAIVTEAFRVDLSRSTLVRTVAASEVIDALQRAGRDPTTRIDAQLARELAEREGIKAIIEGEVATTAGAYVLTARLVSGATGEQLSAHRETARDSTGLLAAIDRLSHGLRERTGESLRDVRRSEPLEQVMTPSLEALRLFTDAARAHRFEGDPPRAAQLLEQAVALDTAFASAHRFLGVLWTNRGRPDLALEATERALRFPDRLTERERHLTQASVHMSRREYNEAIGAYEALLARYPQDATALNNAGLMYGALNDYSRAVQYYQRAVAADTTSFFSYANLGETLILDGRFEEAREAFDAARRRAPGSAWPVVGHATLPAAEGDYAAAEAALATLREDPTAPRAVVNGASRRLVQVTRAQGRLREARSVLEATLRANQPHAEAEAALTIDRAFEELLLHDRADRAVALLQQVAAPLDTLPPLATPLIDAAFILAWAGDAAGARALLDRYASPQQRAVPWADSWAIAAEGLVALAEGDTIRAIGIFRRVQERYCIACEELLIARAFDSMQQPDSAIAAYERYLASPSLDRVAQDQYSVGPLHERLAQLYEQTGRTDSAVKNYARLIQLWRNADPELQPRVRAAQQALERLVADRG